MRDTDILADTTLRQQLEAAGFARLDGPRLFGQLTIAADHWAALVRSWNDLGPDLYMADGLYGRWNPTALVALAAGVAAALIGLAVPALRILYDYAWFVGAGVAALVYLVGMKILGDPAAVVRGDLRVGRSP